MTDRTLLVLILNMGNPIPNAAAIISHQPDSVLIVRVKSHRARNEELLDQSMERLLAWSKGELLEYYQFAPDFHPATIPNAPEKTPHFGSVLVEQILNSGNQIRRAIEDDSKMRDSSVIILESSSGRKEDVASLTRLSGELSSNCVAGVWYTDATTGLSVEIGSSLVRREKPPMSQIDRLWMNGFPVVGVKNIMSPGKLLRTGLLTPTLDAIEEASSLGYPDPNEGRISKEEWRRRKLQLMFDALEDRGLVAEVEGEVRRKKHPLFFRIRPTGKKGPSIRIPGHIFDMGDGTWLEELTAMAISESWDCETVFVGVSIGDASHESRMRRLSSALRRPNMGHSLSQMWTFCKKEGLIPPELPSGERGEDGEPVMFSTSELDFLDEDVFEWKKYTPSWYEDPTEEHNILRFKREIRSFTEWATNNWEKIPPDFRRRFTQHFRIRDLDVLVETSSHCLFVECKLNALIGRTEQGKSQIDSIVASAGSRGTNFSILSHDTLSQEKWRGGDFQFIVPWKNLRDPEGLLSGVISSKSVPQFFPKHRRRKTRQDNATELEGEHRDNNAVDEGSQGKRRRGGAKIDLNDLDWEPTPASEKPPEFNGDEFPPRARYYCPVEDCMETFPKHSSLVAHIRDTGHNGYKCEECGDFCHSNRSVKKHAQRNPGHLSFSGKCYRIHDLKLPITPHQESLDALDADGFYESAIQKSLTSAEVAKGIEKATGKFWRDVFATSANIRIHTYFNERDTGKLLFVQNDSGVWVATEPEPSEGE